MPPGTRAGLDFPLLTTRQLPTGDLESIRSPRRRLRGPERDEPPPLNTGPACGPRGPTSRTREIKAHVRLAVAPVGVATTRTVRRLLCPVVRDLRWRWTAQCNCTANCYRPLYAGIAVARPVTYTSAAECLPSQQISLTLVAIIRRGSTLFESLSRYPTRYQGAPHRTQQERSCPTASIHSPSTKPTHLCSICSPISGSRDSCLCSTCGFTRTSDSATWTLGSRRIKGVNTDTINLCNDSLRVCPHTITSIRVTAHHHQQSPVHQRALQVSK